ncbi:PAS domain S-box protein [Thermodesulfatator indicus]
MSEISQLFDTHEAIEVLRVFLESASVGIYLYREEFIYVNPAFEKITGWKLSELKNKKVWELVHPDYRETVKERTLARLRGEKTPPQYEIKILTSEGQEKWFEVSVATFEKDNQIYCIATTIDITEIKNYSRNLADTLSEYKAILQAFDGLLYTVTPDFRLAFVNKKLEKQIGHPVSGELCYEEIFGLKEPCPWCSLKEVLEGRSVKKDIHIPEEDKWYYVVATPLIYPDGSQHALHILMDITQQKRAQQEILRISKLESISLLAGGIAHDFNNILTAILGNISLLRLRLKKHLTEKEEKLFKQMESVCFRAQGLTKQLLNFAEGGSPIKRVASIKEMIEDTVSFCLRGSNVSWEISIPDDLFLVNIDTVQFGQVVSNIVINAKQAMPSGGRLWIKASNLKLKEPKGPLKPGDYVEIIFRDEGMGIPKKHLSKIFDPYFTTKKDGSGLGLAICHSIIKKHGGHIEVTSQKGKGATFKIYLPASKEEKPTSYNLVQKEIFKGKGRVLIFDDEEVIRETLKEVLEMSGFQVEEAKDAQEVIQKIKAQNFDLAILDLTIPGGMGAKEVLPFIKSYTPKTKTILMSGYSLEAQKVKEFDAFLKKPFTFDELFAVIDKLLPTKSTKNAKNR